MVLVLPNPSGRNANFIYEETLAAFRALKRSMESARRRSGFLCSAALTSTHPIQDGNDADKEEDSARDDVKTRHEFDPSEASTITQQNSPNHIPAPHRASASEKGRSPRN
jgi:hypothetical protein